MDSRRTAIVLIKIIAQELNQKERAIKKFMPFVSYKSQTKRKQRDARKTWYDLFKRD